jgi:hypothetical protein
MKPQVSPFTPTCRLRIGCSKANREKSTSFLKRLGNSGLGWIVIEAVSPRPPGTLMERLKIFTYKLGQTDFRGEPLPLDPETATRYSCVVPHFDQLQDWQVSCISNDDLWSVTLYGTVSDIDDFLVVLRYLAAAQK